MLGECQLSTSLRNIWNIDWLKAPWGLDNFTVILVTTESGSGLVPHSTKSLGDTSQHLFYGNTLNVFHVYYKNVFFKWPKWSLFPSHKKNNKNIDFYYNGGHSSLLPMS